LRGIRFPRATPCGLVAEIPQAPADVPRPGKRILGVVVAVGLVIGLVALLAPIADAMWWWSFG